MDTFNFDAYIEARIKEVFEKELEQFIQNQLYRIFDDRAFTAALEQEVPAIVAQMSFKITVD
jgi:hypothetical protein